MVLDDVVEQMVIEFEVGFESEDSSSSETESSRMKSSKRILDALFPC